MNSKFQNFSFNSYSLASYTSVTLDGDSSATFFSGGKSYFFSPFLFFFFLMFFFAVVWRSLFSTAAVSYQRWFYSLCPASEIPSSLILPRILSMYTIGYIFCTSIYLFIENLHSTQAFPCDKIKDIFNNIL